MLSDLQKNHRTIRTGTQTSCLPSSRTFSGKPCCLLCYLFTPQREEGTIIQAFQSIAPFIPHHVLFIFTTQSPPDFTTYASFMPHMPSGLQERIDSGVLKILYTQLSEWREEKLTPSACWLGGWKPTHHGWFQAPSGTGRGLQREGSRCKSVPSTLLGPWAPSMLQMLWLFPQCLEWSLTPKAAQ